MAEPARLERVDRVLVLVERAAAVLATLAAVYSFVYSSTHAGALWRDEVNGVSTATGATLADVWRLLEFESFPIGWVLLLRIWMSVFGTTDAAFRVFALLCGLTLPAAAWFALRRLTGRVPIISVALLAVTPEIIRWTTSVRAWGLGAALAICALAVIRDATAEISRRRVLVAALVAIAAVQMQYQNALLILGITVAASLVAALRRQWTAALVPIGVGAAAALSLLPYAGVFARRGQWNALGENPLTLDDLTGQIRAVSLSAGSTVQACAVVLLVCSALIALHWVVFSRSRSSNRSKRGLVIYAALASVVCAIALLEFYLKLKYQPQVWYFAGLLSVVIVCADIMLASAQLARTGRVIRVVTAGLILVAGMTPTKHALRERHTNVDAIARILATEGAPTDLVLVNPWFVGVSLSHYYRGPATVMTVAALADFHVHRYDLVKAAMSPPDPLEPVRAAIQKTLSAGHTVWFVGNLPEFPPGTAAVTLPPAPLPGSGWNVGPYQEGWEQATAVFIGLHVSNRERRDVPASGGRFENETLTRLTGWK